MGVCLPLPIFSTPTQSRPHQPPYYLPFHQAVIICVVLGAMCEELPTSSMNDGKRNILPFCNPVANGNSRLQISTSGNWSSSSMIKNQEETGRLRESTRSFLKILMCVESLLPPLIANPMRDMYLNS